LASASFWRQLSMKLRQDRIWKHFSPSFQNIMNPLWMFWD